jgi:hypothetical protein
VPREVTVTFGLNTPSGQTAVQSQEIAKAFGCDVVTTFNKPGPNEFDELKTASTDRGNTLDSGRQSGTMDQNAPANMSIMSDARLMYDRISQGKDFDWIVHSEGEIVAAAALTRVEQQLLGEGVSADEARNRLSRIHIVSFGGASGDPETHWKGIGSFQRVYSEEDLIANGLGAGEVPRVIGSNVKSAHSWEDTYWKYAQKNADKLFNTSGVFVIRKSGDAEKVREFNPAPDAGRIRKFD